MPLLIMKKKRLLLGSDLILNAKIIVINLE